MTKDVSELYPAALFELYNAFNHRIDASDFARSLAQMLAPDNTRDFLIAKRMTEFMSLELHENNLNDVIAVTYSSYTDPDARDLLTRICGVLSDTEVTTMLAEGLKA